MWNWQIHVVYGASDEKCAIYVESTSFVPVLNIKRTLEDIDGRID